jgi:hypothetical protein
VYIIANSQQRETTEQRQTEGKDRGEGIITNSQAMHVFIAEEKDIFCC